MSKMTTLSEIFNKLRESCLFHHCVNGIVYLASMRGVESVSALSRAMVRRSSVALEV